jgi:hypothetical protein
VGQFSGEVLCFLLQYAASTVLIESSIYLAWYQRKKYKDLSDGKRNNLSAEQVSRLNSIGAHLQDLLHL